MRSPFSRIDFNPRSPHGERRASWLSAYAHSGISIHAPRTGSDHYSPISNTTTMDFNPRSPHGERRWHFLRRFARHGNISIHAPRTGSDLGQPVREPQRKQFQSTLPARGATFLPADGGKGDYFNPRSPHGERPVCSDTRSHLQDTFQSTLPARGATEAQRPCCARADISIHAPRTGSDINPVEDNGRVLISIHAPRTGSDRPRGVGERVRPHFNPRSPHGERPTRRRGACASAHFNPRSPHGERRAGHARRNGGQKYFNPRSPHGERLRKVTILSIRIIGFAQKVYHKTVLLRISLAENAVILPEKPRNPVRTSLQKAGGLRFARAIRAARPYSISSPSGA